MAASDSVQPEEGKQGQTPARKKFQFPTALTTVAVVTVVVWLAALFIPAGTYEHDEYGAPIPGTYRQVPSPLDPGDRVRQLVLSPVNGLYGLKNEDGYVDTETSGTMFGAVGVVLFILSIGAFISVSFATRSLEVAIGSLAIRLRDKGWLLITAIMVLFSLLGTTMGFSVETLGFYSLFIPLMAVLGYDRLVTATMIIVGALVGVTTSTVNPFATGVAAGEAEVSIGDGIGLRVVLWVLLTGIAIVYLLRYAARVRRDPSASLVGFDLDRAEGEAGGGAAGGPGETMAHERLTGTQKWVLAITIATFALMIFSVIPWASILGGTAGPADDTYTHETAVEPYWFELNWWFPQLSMLFALASVVVGLVARMGEREIVQRITAGAADMIGPSMVIMLAAGVSVIMTNTQTLDTILQSVEQIVRGTSVAVFAVLNIVVNLPLSFIVPSSSGHATLAMPLLAPLSDFAEVNRSVTITAFQLGHGLMLMASPTAVVVMGGLTIAKVSYAKYLRFVLPMLFLMFLVSAVVLGVATTIG
jgi:uncharacterized ion transporter superfamily protein YfcC